MISFKTWSHIACLVLIFMFFSSNIVSTHGFDSLLQLPQSGSARAGSKSIRVLRVDDFGAIGDGFSDDTEAFENAWDTACSLSKRTTVTIPKGKTFLLRPTNFSGHCRSKITLRIEGAIIAPRDPDIWKDMNPRRWLYFQGVNHLTLEGGGTIDGMGQEWWARSCKINATNPCHHAPTAITFHKCKYLKVGNLMVINSQQMHMAFTSCCRVLVDNLRVVAPAFSPNTDGIHISASHSIVVKNSIIRTGDDCVSIVNNSSRILINNIACGPGHGISIGSLGKSKSWALVQDVIVDGAMLSDTDNGVRIKTWQGGKGFATNILFRNIFMRNVSNPIIIDQYYCDSSLPCSNKTSAVKVENISFINIRGTSASAEAITFACSDSFPCKGLYLENIHLTSYPGGHTKSFCWQAYGSTRGAVYPPSCFSEDYETFIKQKVPDGSSLQSF